MAKKTTKKTTAKKATAKKKAATKAVKRTSATMYRLEESPANGRDLWTYTMAVFTALGMIGRNPKTVPAAAISRFYDSPSILRHHGPTGNGNLECPTRGQYKISAKGKAKFLGRYADDSAQWVEKSEAGKLAKALKSGDAKDLPDEWEGFKLFAIEIPKG